MVPEDASTVPSPFRGMDPYLEHRGPWAGVQGCLRRPAAA